MTNHKKLGHWVTGPELPFFHKRKGILKTDQSVKIIGSCNYFIITRGIRNKTEQRCIYAKNVPEKKSSKINDYLAFA